MVVVVVVVVVEVVVIGTAVVVGVSDHAATGGMITVIGVSITSQDAPKTAETDTRRTVVAARLLLVFTNLMPSI